MGLIASVTSFTQELNKHQIPFAVIGGLAVFAYGGERTTFDVDFLIHGENKNQIKTIAASLKLNIINENDEVIQLSGPTQIDVIFANRPQTQGMLTRIQAIEGLPFPVVAPEDLVGLKIQAFVGNRAREFIDKGDILTIFKNVQGLDYARIKDYAEIFGVWKEIENLKNHI